MFARRRSSSSPKKSIAFLTCLLCCVAVNLIENVVCMSLERLAIDHQNESQMDYSETMAALAPEELNRSNSAAYSDMLSDVSDESTISVVPVEEGQSDVYLLVPAAGAHIEKAENVLPQSLAGGHHDDMAAAMDDLENSEGLSDMVMLESEDTPAIQILEVPEQLMEQKLEEEMQKMRNNLESEYESATQVTNFEEVIPNSTLAQISEVLEEIKSNQAEMELPSNESEAVTETMANMLVETVEEIEKELETELLGNHQQQQQHVFKHEENASPANDEHEKEISAELPMEHKDVLLDESKLSAKQESNESKIEMQNFKMQSDESMQVVDAAAEQPINDSTAEEPEVTTEVVEFPIIIEDISEMSSDSEAMGSEQFQWVEGVENMDQSENIDESKLQQEIKVDQQKAADRVFVSKENKVANIESNLVAENSALETEASADIEDLNPAMDSSEPENNDQTAEETIAESTSALESQNDKETLLQTSPIEESPITENILNMEEESVTSKAEEEDNLTTEDMILGDDVSQDKGNEILTQEVEETTANITDEEPRVTESSIQSEDPNAAEEMQSEQNMQGYQIMNQYIPLQHPVALQLIAENPQMHEVTKNNEEQHSIEQSLQKEPLEISQTIEEPEFVTEYNSMSEDPELPQQIIQSVENSDELKPTGESEINGESQSADSLKPLQEELNQKTDNVQTVEKLKPEDDVQSYEDIKISEEEHVDHEQLADDSQSFTDAKPASEGDHNEVEIQSTVLHLIGQQKPQNHAVDQQTLLLGDQQSLEDAHSPEHASVEQEQSVDEYQNSDDMQSLQDARPSIEETQQPPAESGQTQETPEHPEVSQAVEESDSGEKLEDSHSVQYTQAAEEVASVTEMEADIDSQNISESQNVEEIQSASQAAEMQSLESNQAEEDNQLNESHSAENSDVSKEPQHEAEEAQVSAGTQALEEEVSTNIHENSSESSDSFPMFDVIEVAKEQTASDQLEILEPMPEIISIAAEKETASLSDPLTDEESLQTIEIAEVPQQFVTQDHSHIDNKDDAILHDDTGAGDAGNNNLLNQVHNQQPSDDRPQESSMLMTILQVPPPPMSDTEMQQQQPQVTTAKPLNVMDSILNYVNASFVSQQPHHQQEPVKDDAPYSSQLRRYDGAQVWRIVVQNERERKLADELQSKYDGQLWKEVKQEVDYLLKPQVLADAERYVRAANLSRIVLIDNLQQVIEVENPPAEEIAQLQNRKGHRLTWEAYHRLDDIHGFFDYMAKTYPDICSVEIIGYSIEKRPLKLLKISNGNANNPGIWIDGGMHAREWIGVSVVTYIANQIVEGWDDLPGYMRSVNWYIHAVANPDGYEYSHTTDRLWRKNMRSHGRACPGVDLNRNFGYKWGGKGTSANPCSQTYRGSKAFSEPETFYISKFISNFPRDTFKGFLSFHSYGQYILYPWGYDYHITKDMTDLDLVARQAGTSITRSSGTKYTVGSSAHTLYPAAGGSDDWAKGFAEIKYSYTIEMGDTGRYGFVLPASHIEPNGKNGLTFVQTVARAITMGKNSRRRQLVRKTN